MTTIQALHPIDMAMTILVIVLCVWAWVTK